MALYDVYRRWADLDDKAKAENAHLHETFKDNNQVWYLLMCEVEIPERMISWVDGTQQQVAFNVDKHEYIESFESYRWGLNLITESDEIMKHV